MADVFRLMADAPVSIPLFEMIELSKVKNKADKELFVLLSLVPVAVTLRLLQETG
jgi:hypothetical protein